MIDQPQLKECEAFGCSETAQYCDRYSMAFKSTPDDEAILQAARRVLDYYRDWICGTGHMSLASYFDTQYITDATLLKIAKGK